MAYAAPRRHLGIFDRQGTRINARKTTVKDFSRPMKTFTKQHNVPRQTVDTGAIMRKSVMKPFAKRRQPARKEENFDDKVGWYQNVEDSFENNAAELHEEAVHRLAEVHERLANKVADLQQAHLQDEENAAHTMAAIFQPLSLTNISITESSPDVARRTTITTLDKRLEAFSENIAACETELAKSWREFDEVQAKLVLLGRDVFGDDMVVGAKAEVEEIARVQKPHDGRKSFKYTIEMWDQETSTKAEGLREDVKNLEHDFFKKMLKLEKKMNDEEEKEKRSLLFSLTT